MGGGKENGQQIMFSRAIVSSSFHFFVLNPTTGMSSSFTNTKKQAAEERQEGPLLASDMMPRRGVPFGENGAPRANEGAFGDASEKEAANHRKAIAEYRARCKGADPWSCAEALLYLVDGPRVVEKYALWLFPSDSERYLVSSNDDGVEEFYVLVRLEGKASLDKLSLGVSRDKAGAFHHAHGKLSDIDPTEGQVVRIVSIEEDGQALPSPDDASPRLDRARHIREVIRKHAGKCEAGADASRFRVLRTQAYLTARRAIEAADCGPEEWDRALQALESPDAFPWKLSNLVAEKGCMDTLREAENALESQVHVVDDIYLVQEELPSTTSEFLAAARWAVQKSIRGTGSIPKAKMYEPVVVSHDTFQLMRMA